MVGGDEASHFSRFPYLFIVFYDILVLVIVIRQKVLATLIYV